MVKAENAPELSNDLFKAGVEFDQTLSKLGLEADLLCWAWDDQLKRHVLVLVTDFFDQVGPLDIAKQLFKAYNASVLPKEIDPFTVRIHSINQLFGAAVLDAADKMTSGTLPIAFPPPEKIEYFIEFPTIGFNSSWLVARRNRKSRTTVDLKRKWRSFEHNVDKAAA